MNGELMDNETLTQIIRSSRASQHIKSGPINGLDRYVSERIGKLVVQVGLQKGVIKSMSHNKMSYILHHEWQLFVSMISNDPTLAEFVPYSVVPDSVKMRFVRYLPRQYARHVSWNTVPNVAKVTISELDPEYIVECNHPIANLPSAAIVNMILYFYKHRIEFDTELIFMLIKSDFRYIVSRYPAFMNCVTLENMHKLPLSAKEMINFLAKLKKECIEFVCKDVRKSLKDSLSFEVLSGTSEMTGVLQSSINKLGV